MSFLTFIALASLATLSAHAVTGQPETSGAPAPAVVLVDNSSEQSLQAAQNFVKNMTDEGIGFLANPELAPEQREEQFRIFLNKNFDMNGIGRFALGHYWKSASSAQQKEYSKLFNEMIIKVYTKRFGDYKGEALEIGSARAEGKYDVLVTSMIVPSSGAKIQLDWRVREKNGSYRVIDVIVEGVSMAMTQRSDFSSVIQRGGGNIEVLLEHLRKN